MDRILLDVHCHLVPVKPADTAGIAGIEWLEASGTMSIDGYNLVAPSVYNPSKLLEWMDSNGVDRAWISVPPPLYRNHLPLDEARIWAGCLNRAMRHVAAAHPDRLNAMLFLPVQHPGLAAEIVREQRSLGPAIFAMPAGDATGNLILSGAPYDELWRALNEAKAFLFLHPCKGCDARLDPFYLHNLLGGPGETALAAAHLAMSGILQRHPDLTLCLAHGGGSTAAVAGRLERGQLTGRPGADTGAEKPRDAFRRVYVDCICHDDNALALAAAIHGHDHVLFGSDWPFSMGLPEPRRQLSNVPRDLLNDIWNENPRSLLAKYSSAG